MPFKREVIQVGGVLETAEDVETDRHEAAASFATTWASKLLLSGRFQIDMNPERLVSFAALTFPNQ
jgi:hypothetical protein